MPEKQNPMDIMDFERLARDPDPSMAATGRLMLAIRPGFQEFLVNCEVLEERSPVVMTAVSMAACWMMATAIFSGVPRSAWPRACQTFEAQARDHTGDMVRQMDEVYRRNG